MKKFNKNSFLHFFTYKKKMCLKSYVLLNNDFVEDGCKAFSLVELMLSLIIISLIAAAFTPVITKKLNRGSIVAGGSTGEISNECNRDNSDGTYSFSSDCELCTKSYCITCNKSPSSGQYVTKKCQYSSCSDFDNDGISCKSCTQNGCSECESGYISAGKCMTCPAGGICDGKSKLDTCPSGYYCEDGQKYSCRNDIFGQHCANCNSTSCYSCDQFYGLINGKCTACNISACKNCDSDIDKCTECNQLSLVNNKCVWCGVDNCSYCNQNISDGCASCISGYFVDSNHGCTQCTIANCETCKSGAASNKPECAECKAGYFMNSNGECKSCSDISNCAACSQSGTCLVCNSGYILNDNKDGCILDNKQKFNCSDENFVKVGNLCFTRRNMGDSSDLTIPSNIVIRKTGETCASNYANCCYKDISTNCNSNNGDYSGCNRTICNYAAAEKICKEFSYAKTGWRLPTADELRSLMSINTGLGNNGMQFCTSGSAVAGLALCKENSLCGANNCSARRVWSSTIKSNSQQQDLAIESGIYNIWWSYIYDTISVRCVLDMGD